MLKIYLIYLDHSGPRRSILTENAEKQGPSFAADIFVCHNCGGEFNMRRSVDNMFFHGKVHTSIRSSVKCHELVGYLDGPLKFGRRISANVSGINFRFYNHGRLERKTTVDDSIYSHH